MMFNRRTSASDTSTDSGAGALPQEIIDQILNELATEDNFSNQQDLRSCLLVHSTFYLTARSHLFTRISFSVDNEKSTQARAIRLLNIYEANPFLLSLLRTFRLNIDTTYRESERQSPMVQAPKFSRTRFFSMPFTSRSPATMSASAARSTHFQNSLLEVVATAPNIKVFSIKGDEVKSFDWTMLNEKTRRQLSEVCRNPSLRRLELEYLEYLTEHVFTAFSHAGINQVAIQRISVHITNTEYDASSFFEIETLEVISDHYWALLKAFHILSLGLDQDTYATTPFAFALPVQLFNNLTSLVIRLPPNETIQWHRLVSSAPKLESLELHDIGVFTIADYDTSFLTPTFIDRLRNLRFLKFRTLTESLKERQLGIFLGFVVQMLRNFRFTFEDSASYTSTLADLRTLELCVTTRPPRRRRFIGDDLPRFHGPVEDTRIYRDSWSLLDQELSGDRTKDNIFLELRNVNVAFMYSGDTEDQGMSSLELLPKTSACGVEVKVERKHSFR